MYVVPRSDAEAYVTHRFPHKATKRVSNGLRSTSVRGFLRRLPIAFQRNQSEGLDATYHFTFTGDEPCESTDIIQNKTIQVHEGHV